MAEIRRNIEALAAHQGFTEIQRAFLEQLSDELTKIAMAKQAEVAIKGPVRGAFAFADEYIRSLMLESIHAASRKAGR